jgi:hypothetical protein
MTVVWTSRTAFGRLDLIPDPMERIAYLADGLAEVEAFAQQIREARDQAIEEARAIPGGDRGRPKNSIPAIAETAKISQTAVKAILR